VTGRGKRKISVRTEARACKGCGVNRKEQIVNEKRSIAVAWDADTGEFVPLFTSADLVTCDKAEIPVVRWHPFKEEYEQRDKEGNWMVVGSE
jgi:hypothetical protein